MSLEKKISVVIATHNRKQILRRTLFSLLDQSLKPGDYEILVADDGSSDGTDEVMRLDFSGDLPTPISYLRQPNKGPGAARNLGIKNAAGDLILFMNDDMSPDQRLLKIHLDEHLARPDAEVAVLGRVAWSGEQPISPLMRWLDRGGPLFAFHRIRGKTEAPWHFFVTANVSLKRQFLSEVGPFDENFREAHDDTEFAWRAKKKGMRLIYREDALAYHHHPLTFVEMTRKMDLVGRMVCLLLRKHPDLSDHFRKSLRQRLIFRHLINAAGIEFWNRVCMRLENRWAPHRLFTEVLRYHYLRGYHSQKDPA